jgi:hypothetical protein
LKKIGKIIIVAFLFISSKSQAQHFGIQGSSWYYSRIYVVPGPTIEEYINIASNGDTTIQGKLCNRLQINTPIMCGDGQATKFTYYSNDSVYFFEPAYNSFQLLYHINATIGDSWFIRVPDMNEEDTISVHVNSTDIINLNGVSLKRLQVSYVTHFDNLLNYSYDSEIIERIGDTRYLFNLFPEWSYTCDESYITGLRCYEDPSMPLYSTGLASTCDFQSYIGLEEQAIDQQIIYPNPSSNVVYLSTVNDLELSYEIFDLLGHSMLNGRTTSEINISSLKSGSYLLFTSDNGLVKSQKIQVMN